MQHAWQLPKAPSTSEETKRDLYRRLTKDMLKRVPAKVSSGSIQTTREFKRFYEKATRILAKPRATEDELQSLYNETVNHYQ